MLTEEITSIVSKLNYGDRAQLIGLLCDSLDDQDIDNSDEDSITVALRRSAEMKSGDDPGMSVNEFWAGVREDLARP